MSWSDSSGGAQESTSECFPRGPFHRCGIRQADTAGSPHVWLRARSRGEGSRSILIPKRKKVN